MSARGTPSRLERVVKLASVAPVVAAFVARVTWELTTTPKADRVATLDALWSAMTGDVATPREKFDADLREYKLRRAWS